MKACLEYLLSVGVPPSKISLGIAGYSDWWYPAYDDTNRARLRGSDISYAGLKATLDSAGVKPVWDDTQKSPHATWEVKGVFRHAWLQGARAFMANLELARTHHLTG